MDIILQHNYESMPPSPYSIFLASYLKTMNYKEKQVLDMGTGCGIQAIVASIYAKCEKIYLADYNENILKDASDNCIAHNVLNFSCLKSGYLFDPIPTTQLFDVIICNPASLPSKKATMCYFAGEDGRDMIHNLILYCPIYLKNNGKLIMVHTSLANLMETQSLCALMRLDVKIVKTMDLAFRAFYDKNHIDNLGNSEKVLYKMLDGIPHETLYLLEICKNNK